MKKFVSAAGSVGEIEEIQLQPLPPLSSLIGAKRWTKGKKETPVALKGKSNTSLEELCVRLAGIAYIWDQLSETIQKVYRSDTGTITDALEAVLHASSKDLIEFTACKLVNEDLQASVFSSLYRGSDLSSRVDRMIPPFKLLLQRCPARFFSAVLLRSLDYFVDSWNRSILSSERSPDQRESFARDLTSVQHFFEAKQKTGEVTGIPRSDQAQLLTSTTELMSLALMTDEALMNAFVEPESAGQRRVSIAYLLHYRQSRTGLEFIAEHRQLVL